MNLDKLRQVRELIVRTPAKNFNMRDFAKDNAFGRKVTYQNPVMNYICGSACCIGGHAVLADSRFSTRVDGSLRTIADNETLTWTEAFSVVLESTQYEAMQIANPNPTDVHLYASGIAQVWTRWTKEDGLKWLDYWIEFYADKQAASNE